MARQVTRNSNNIASGSQLAANPSLRAGLGSSSVSQDDVITPSDGVSDIGGSRTTPSSAGESASLLHLCKIQVSLSCLAHCMHAFLTSVAAEHHLQSSTL